MELFLSIESMKVLQPSIRYKEEETFWQLLAANFHLKVFLIGFLISLLFALVSHFMLKVVNLWGTVLIVLFGSFIFLMIGLTGLEIYILFLTFDFLLVMYRRWKFKKSGIATDKYSLIDGLHVLSVSLFPSFMALFYFLEVSRPRDCMGMETIYPTATAASLITLTTYLTSVDISISSNIKRKLSTFGIIISLIIGVYISYLYLTSKGLPNINRYTDPYILIWISIPFVISMIVHVIASITHLNPRHFFLVLLAAIGGGFLSVSSPLFFTIKQAPPWETGHMALVIGFLLISFMVQKMPRFALIVSLMYVVLALSVPGLPCLIPFIMFIIIDTISRKILYAKEKKSGISIEYSEKLQSKYISVTVIISGIFSFLFGALMPDSELFYLGIVIAFASGAIYSILIHYDFKTDTGLISILIQAFIFSGLIAFISYLTYQPMLLGVNSMSLFLMPLTTVIVSFVIVLSFPSIWKPLYSRARDIQGEENILKIEEVKSIFRSITGAGIVIILLILISTFMGPGIGFR